MAPQTGLGRNEWYLDAKGIGAVNLRGCRLVVLSGCSTGRLQETALSDPNSLVRAFLAAGARTVVASRWNVDSRTTERLMEVFYQALGQGSEPAGALKLAETAVRLRAETAHPYYWSAFTAFGTR
jgi:CHAT domain-containing protein